jgi:Glycosyltransferase family 92
LGQTELNLMISLIDAVVAKGGSPNKRMNGETKARVRIHRVVMVCLALGSLGHLGIVNPWQTNSTKGLVIVNEVKNSSCINYRAYPWPKDHSGLPYLADVFTTLDSEYVMFIGINRGSCLEKFVKSKADGFSDYTSHGYRFMCMFNGKIPVISEFVTPSARSFGMYNFVFRCKLPDQVKVQVQAGQSETALHVDLHSLHDLEQPTIETYNIRAFPSRPISELPKIADIPVCHPSPTQTQQTYNLTAHTRLKSSYLLNHYVTDATDNRTYSLPHLYRNQTVSPHYRVKEWIAYHQTQGFDHFVIYDNNMEPHSEIEALLQPYVQSGLVTYRWFPLQDCYLDYGEGKGLFRAYAQGAAGIAALHRMGTNTQFFASLDIDEFLVLYDGRTVMQFMNSIGEDYDCVGFRPTVVDYCNGTKCY